MWCKKARYCKRNLQFVVIEIKDILKMEPNFTMAFTKSKVNILFVYKCFVKKKTQPFSKMYKLNAIQRKSLYLT